MRTRLIALLGATALVTTTIQLSPAGSPSAEGVDAPSMDVGGDAMMYPAYSPAISRYAVHPGPDGSVRVDVTGAAQVWFDGVPDADGTATFTGLTPGEEISVFLDTGAGRRTHALYVLPEGFPTLEATSTGATLTPGNIALTLDRFDSTSPKFETIVDRHGVPVYTHPRAGRSMDLKLAANGRLTVHRRPTTTQGRTGGALVELDDQFNEVRRHETAGLVDTDDHDSLLLPDGSVWLLAYEHNATTGLVDSVVQHLDPEGNVVWDWSSAPFALETVTPENPDYAHANSLDVRPNGDVLVSFRHLSSVFLIRPGAGSGTEEDEVVWKLGGRDSDFTFPTGDVGPCAQHSATILPESGNVLMFDNGSGGAYFNNLCVDQTDPDGDPVERPTSRVVEFELSSLPSGEAKGVAAVERTYGDTDRFAFFMASARQLETGNILIGWASAPPWMATETDATGDTIWRLGEVRPEIDPPRPYLPYRAALVPERDGFDPQVVLDGPADGLTVTQGSVVPVEFSCTDRGGSTLRSCDGPSGRRLDTTTAGTRTWSVTARDGSGRTTTRTRSYTVAAAPSAPTPTAPTPPQPTAAPLPATPDLSVRVLPRRRWVGTGALAPTVQDVRAGARPRQVVRARVRLINVGDTRGRFRLRAPASVARGQITLSYRSRGRLRTHAVSGRGWRTPAMAPGDRLRVTVRAKGGKAIRKGRHAVRIRAIGEEQRDRVRIVLRAR